MENRASTEERKYSSNNTSLTIFFLPVNISRLFPIFQTFPQPYQTKTLN